jgi:hypothetical protein
MISDRRALSQVQSRVGVITVSGRYAQSRVGILSVW